MTRFRITVTAYALAGVLIGLGALGTAALPSSCGEIGRPGVLAGSFAALVAAGVLWALAGPFGWVRPVLFAVWAVELAALIAAGWYLHHQYVLFLRCQV